MAIIGSLLANLKAHTAQFDTPLKRSSQQMASFGKQMRGLSQMAGIAIGGAALVRFAKDSVASYMRQEEAVDSLSASLKMLKQHSFGAVESAKAFASQIQKTTVIGDEAVLELMSLGASMGGLFGTELERATKAAIGLSERLKIDTNAAMTLVAKAAQGNTSTLSRYGIVLNEVLTPQEKLNEVLRLGADAFSLATSRAQTQSGQLKQLANDWDDLKETIGGIAMQAAMGATLPFTNRFHPGARNARTNDAMADAAISRERDAYRKLTEDLTGVGGFEIIRRRTAAVEEYKDALRGLLAIDGAGRPEASATQVAAGFKIAADHMRQIEILRRYAGPPPLDVDSAATKQAEQMLSVMEKQIEAQRELTHLQEVDRMSWLGADESMVEQLYQTAEYLDAMEAQAKATEKAANANDIYQATLISLRREMSMLSNDAEMLANIQAEEWRAQGLSEEQVANLLDQRAWLNTMREEEGSLASRFAGGALQEFRGGYTDFAALSKGTTLAEQHLAEAKKQSGTLERIARHDEEALQ